MLHDISPATYNNDFTIRKATAQDKVLVYRERKVLARIEGDAIFAPTFADLGIDPATEGATLDDPATEEPTAKDSAAEEKTRYLYAFSVGDDAYFFARLSEAVIDQLADQEGWEFIVLPKLVDYQPKPVRFALTVGFEYWVWYSTAQYCGRCGTKNEHDHTERMMRCPVCNNMTFPKLYPAVIVGITRSDGKVLATRYAGRPYANYALVAGFCEMGETVEQTVHREVMEEVGLRVKNLRYYKSQPWPDSNSLLFGFFCELDGSPEIILDEHELSMAEWIDRDMLLTDNDHSLTREMMGVLRDHRETDFPITQYANRRVDKKGYAPNLSM
ncbi:NAD(+) diphosphatase [Anaerotardibacter muris]|uniref:NAD(+) diphosphatase n=1 Tax=Anaerotardibacter muris TaxID=2941505 RepID=UPI0020404035|nr:NAD(+) diphosphatase [Anaerotardibacter muris]